MAHLIDKDALIAKIEKEIKCIYAGREYVGIPSNEENIIIGIQKVEDIINTMEVEEVDLEKELNDYGLYYDYGSFDRKEMLDFANHFFELGFSINNHITVADRGMAEEIITNLKQVEQDYRVNLTKEIEWLRNKVKKGE
jgi:hypothetical protein